MKLHLARDRPAVVVGDRAHHDAGPRQARLDLDRVARSRRAERQLDAAPTSGRGVGHEFPGRGIPGHGKGQAALRIDAAGGVPPSRRIGDLHDRPGHGPGGIADRGVHPHAFAARELAGDAAGGEQAVGREDPTDERDRAARGKRRDRTSVRDELQRIALLEADDLAGPAWLAAGPGRDDDVGLAEPFVVPPGHVVVVGNGRRERAVGTDAVGDAHRDGAGAGVRPRGRDGEKVVAVGEVVGDRDRRPPGRGGGDGLQSHPAPAHGEVISGDRRTTIGRRAGGAKLRQARRRVVAAQLVVGPLAGREIDDAPTHVADGHVRMPGRDRLGDHGHDPVVAEHMVAVNPVGLLAGGSDGGGVARRERDHFGGREGAEPDEADGEAEGAAGHGSIPGMDAAGMEHGGGILADGRAVGGRRTGVLRPPLASERRMRSPLPGAERPVQAEAVDHVVPPPLPG